MDWYAIVGIVLAGIMLVFVILSWAGIVPKKVTESTPLKSLAKFDVAGIVTLAIVGTVIYLAVTGKEIPSTFAVILPTIIILIFFRKN